MYFDSAFLFFVVLWFASANFEEVFFFVLGS